MESFQRTSEWGPSIDDVHLNSESKLRVALNGVLDYSMRGASKAICPKER